MKKDNWEIKKLGEVCGINYGERVVKNKVIEGDYFVFGGGGATFKIDKYNRKDSLVISRFGMSKQCVRFVSGAFFLNDSGLSLSIKEADKLKQSYLNYHIFALNGDIYLCSKGVAQKNLDIPSFKKLEISIPPLPVQEAIVKELDTLHRLKELQEQQLAEYDTLAQATFHSMFGDPIENEKGWEVKKMGEVCEITSSKRIFAKEYQESGIPFYRSKEIIEKSKKLPVSLELFISKERYLEIKTSFGTPKIGDILMTAVGTIGEIWVVDTDDSFYFKDGNILWLKISKSGNSIFFKYSLSILVSEYKKRMSIGSAYNALTIVNLKNMQSILPPISLQNQFAERIEKIEAQKELVKQSIAETQTLIDYTMDKYFG